MNTIDEQTTLADIINVTPGSARVLEGYELDYCCHGRRPLAEACSEAGIDASAVLDSLNSLGEQDGDSPDWMTLGATELADHVESKHHTYLHSEMPRIEALAVKVADVHGERHPELLEVRDTYRELQADLVPHLMKEEQVLFPMIRELDEADGPKDFHCGSLQNPISVMLSEHDVAGELLARLRKLTSGYETPADGCASYKALYDGLAEIESDTHLHIHKENNVLFPMVVEMENQRC
ncbi:MAG: iron-sulfur cluster repair di-iron protein [Microthrixaceae bacterium]|nr:iron-sulfur cluster repair di-iron protein [Microthrixaceae bacterium]